MTQPTRIVSLPHAVFHASGKSIHPNSNQKPTTMKTFKNNVRACTVAAGLFAAALSGAKAAEAGSYTTNDLLMFFRNPNGTAGTTSVAYFNLGSTYNVFRAAATPLDPTFGTVISLGNINSLLTTTYGTDWTGLSSTIFAGAQGQNGATASLATTTSNGDYARTTYVTKPRSSAGTFQQANSSSPLYDPATTGVPGAIQGANNIGGMTQPGVVANNGTTLDDQNPIVNGNPGTAYNAFNGGIIGGISSTTYSYGSISDVVLGLDLFRVTKTSGTGTDNASIWQTANDIDNPLYTGSYPGSTARADYLGTITLSDNGDVNFAAVPEPSTYALLALAAAGLGAHVIRRRKRQS